MPAKKIKVVPVDAPVAEPSPEEPTTDAQAMDEVINDIKTTDDETPATPL